MATLRELIIRVSANTATYQSELARASRLGSNYYKTMESGAKRLDAANKKNLQVFNQLNNQVNHLSSSAANFAKSLGASLAVIGAVDAADNWGQMAARIKMALNSAEGDVDKYAAVQNRLLVVSNRNAKAIEDSQELYISSAKSMQELGYNTGSTLDYIESLSSAFTRNATSTLQTQSAINALNKSMVAGKVSGQNWNTIASAIPSVISNIAEHLGVTELEVKKLAANGDISMKLFADAVIGAKDANNAMADSMQNTVRDGFTKLTNSIKAYIGELNQSNGATSVVAEALGTLAENIDYVAAAGATLAGVGLARYFGNISTSALNATKELIKNQRAKVDLAQAQLSAARSLELEAKKETLRAEAAARSAIGTDKQTESSIRLAQARNAERIATEATATAQAKLNAVALSGTNIIKNLASGALNLIGGPVGAAMIAGGALFYFHQQAQQARQSAIDLSEKVKSLNQNLLEMSQTQREAEAASLFKDVRESENQINVQKTMIALTEKEVAQLERRVEAWGRFSLAEDELIKKREDLKIQLGELEKMEQGRADSLDRINQLNSKSLPIVKQLVADIESLSTGTSSATNSFDGFEKAANSLALQLDVASLNASGTAKEAYILAELQKVAGDAALKHKDDLIALAKGQKVSGAITDELAGKLTDYAAKLGQLFDSNKQTKSVGKSANGVADAFKRQVENQRQQIALFGQTTELAKIQYQLAEGDLKNLDAAKKLVLERNAAELDKLNAQREFKTLMESLQTDEERRLSTAKEHFKIIKNAQLSAEEYNAAMERASKVSVTEAPKYGGLPSDVGGAASELINIAKAEQELQKWHEKQIEMQNELFASKEINEQTHLDRLYDINKQYSDRISDLNDSYKAAAAIAFSDVAGNAADMAKRIYGEQSGIYQGLFIAQKAFAIAAIIMNAQIAAAKAPAELTVLGGIPVGQALLASGYANAAMVAGMSLSGMAHSGIDNVPKEGTWLLDRGERVIDARTNADLKQYLSNANGGGRGGNNFNINVPVSTNGDVNEQDANDLGKLINLKVREVISTESRPGGILNRRG